MLIKIGDFEFTAVWDGVLYKKLSNYPNISDWEIRTIIEFIEYEKKYGRTCDIECDNENTLRTVLDSIKQKEAYLCTPRPKLLTECTACPYRKGGNPKNPRSRRSSSGRRGSSRRSAPRSNTMRKQSVRIKRSRTITVSAAHSMRSLRMRRTFGSRI